MAVKYLNQNRLSTCLSLIYTSISLNMGKWTKDFAFINSKNDESKSAILLNTCIKDYIIPQMHTQENKKVTQGYLSILQFYQFLNTQLWDFNIF